MIFTVKIFTRPSGKNSGSSGFAVILGVGAAAPTPKTTELPNKPE
jgi:hypothetical protein